MKQGRVLEKHACKLFVCSKENQIIIWCQQLHFRSIDVEEKAQNIFRAYVAKKCYNNTILSAKRVIAASIYLASILCGERRTQEEIKKVTDISPPTLRKYYTDIIDILELDFRHVGGDKNESDM